MLSFIGKYIPVSAVAFPSLPKFAFKRRWHSRCLNLRFTPNACALVFLKDRHRDGTGSTYLLAGFFQSIYNQLFPWRDVIQGVGRSKSSVVCHRGSSGWQVREAVPARGFPALFGGTHRREQPPRTPTLRQVCCLLNSTGFVPDRARLCCSDLKRDGALPCGWFTGRQRFPPTRRVFWGEAKAVFTLKTESAETHRALSSLPRESGKRIAIFCGQSRELFGRTRGFAKTDRKVEN